MAPSARQPLTTSQLTTLINASSSALPIEVLVDILAEYEPEARMLHKSVSDERDLATGFYASYLIALLLVDDLNEARYLTHRWPAKFPDKDPVLVNCKALLRAIWSNKYTLAHELLRETSWPQALQPLISRFQDHFQQLILAELTLAYSSLSQEKVSILLGLHGETPDAVILEKLTTRGWRWDDTKGLWFPGLPPTNNDSGVANGGAATGNDGMSGLVELIGFLGE